MLIPNSSLVSLIAASSRVPLFQYALLVHKQAHYPFLYQLGFSIFNDNYTASRMDYSIDCGIRLCFFLLLCFFFLCRQLQIASDTNQ